MSKFSWTKTSMFAIIEAKRCNLLRYHHRTQLLGFMITTFQNTTFADVDGGV